MYEFKTSVDTEVFLWFIAYLINLKVFDDTYIVERGVSDGGGKDVRRRRNSKFPAAVT